jgi:hypothetical protein
VLFDMENDPGEERNVADAAGNSRIVSDLRARLWSDGETWESLSAKRESSREAAQRDRSARTHTPNQYALADGSLADAEETLYPGEYLNG